MYMVALNTIYVPLYYIFCQFCQNTFLSLFAVVSSHQDASERWLMASITPKKFSIPINVYCATSGQKHLWDTNVNALCNSYLIC